MAKGVRLRRFLYLDEGLTNNYLSQLEGGMFEEESQTTTSTRERKRGIGAGAGPVKGELSGSRSGEDVTSRTVKQLGDSAFTRLADSLEAGDAVQWLETLDDEIWGQLRRGEVVEVEANVSLPTLFQFTALAGSGGALLELMRASGEEINEETEQGVQMAAMLGQLLKDPVALAKPSGSPEYTLILPMETQSLRVDPNDLQGEMTVWGTIERKLRDGEQWSLLDAMGLNVLPNAQELVENLDAQEDMQGNVVRPPAAVLKPVAIYR